MKKIIKKPSINLVRYKKDLRVADHRPLYEACQQGLPVVAIYVWEPHIMQGSDYSHFHQYRIQESLKDLKRSLMQLNIPLLMWYGEMSEVCDIVQQHYHISQVYAHQESGNHLTYMRDVSMIQYCNNHDIMFTECPSNGVVRRLQSRDLRSLMHCQRMTQPQIPIPLAQETIQLDTTLVEQSKQSFIGFKPASKPSTWIHQHDTPGETAGQVRLGYFLTHAGPYRYALSRPQQSVMDSSRLSGYLTFGNLSTKQVHQATQQQIKHLSSQTKDNKSIAKQISSLKAFYQRLFWRCHFIQKLESQPAIEHDNQNYAFNTLRIHSNHDLIQARYYGHTGIPMIDTGMRCLQATGWINFRMRATLVSFICNTCMQPRQAIGPMLAKLFLDYEPGIHYSQLQMQSGTTGINTIRIYNPIKQLSDKDHDLTFVRRWLPELVDLTHDEIMTLGTTIGNQILSLKSINYPVAIIDVVQANRDARVALRGVKKTDESKSQAKKVYAKLGSRKSPTRHTKGRTKKIASQQDNLFS